MTGSRRILLILVVAVIVGPKILLLLPVWLMGAWAYSVTKRCAFKMSTSLILFIGSILAYVALKAFDLPLRLGWHTAELLGTDIYEHSLAESRNFLFSYIAGVMVTANFIGFSSISKHIVLKKIPFESVIRFLASYTFTLYLLHQPLLNFFAAILHNNPRAPLDQIFLLLLTLVAVVAVGTVTEHKKAWWRYWFEKLFKNAPSVAHVASK